MRQEFSKYADQVKRYPFNVSVEKTNKLNVGLCADCHFMRCVESDRGSTFYFCERSATDASFPKYPRLPMVQCAGYKPLDLESKRDNPE